ncbi:MAG: hypothetical protein ABEH88_02010, partial [Halobacteriales archaeon]
RHRGWRSPVNSYNRHYEHVTGKALDDRVYLFAVLSAIRRADPTATVHVAAISVPTRYLHTVTESAHHADIEGTIDLLVAFLETESDDREYLIMSVVVSYRCSPPPGVAITGKQLQQTLLHPDTNSSPRRLIVPGQNDVSRPNKPQSR